MRGPHSRNPRLSNLFARAPNISLWHHQRCKVIYRSYCAAHPSPVLPAASVKDPPKPPADHRQLGIEQELYINSPYSPGSPIFLPNGTFIFNKLLELLRAQYPVFGFQEVITPNVYKKSLWEKSGHWENYADDMYAVKGRGAIEDTEGREARGKEEYGLKPMNCPGHCLIFASKARSYRDLPLRYADFGALHRHEISGALSGLTRVRRFHQDDGHIFCRPQQIKEEIQRTLEFIRIIYTALGLGQYRLALSTRPKEKWIGTEEEWNNAENALKSALEGSEQTWTVDEGNGAFYGPKIDIVLKDSDGKEHQTATVQLDFQLPQRFGLEYQAPAPEVEQKGETTTDPKLLGRQGPVTPVLIHRAILGSIERMMALLIEHHKGRWPLWLNPRLATILTTSDDPEIIESATNFKGILESSTLQHYDPENESKAESESVDIITTHRKQWLRKSNPLGRIEIDSSARPLSKKILEAKQKRYAAIIIIGRKEANNKTATVDLSGCQDPCGYIRNSTATAVQETLLRERRDNVCEKNSISPESLKTEAKWKRDGASELVDRWSITEAEMMKKPLVLQASDLQRLQLSPANLRNLLNELSSGYM